jgi:hypothetical protein
MSEESFPGSNGKVRGFWSLGQASGPRIDVTPRELDTSEAK